MGVVSRHRCSFPDVPPDPAENDQSREERLEIARRYRERRGRELRELAATCVEGEVVAAGEFSGIATEALAAIPGLGMVLLPYARRRSRKLGLPPAMLLALDRDTLHMLKLAASDVRRDGLRASPSRSWPRSAVSAERAGRVFMRDRISLRVPDEDEPLTLYVSSLLTNPWSAEVLRLLGAEVPEPLNLS
jgi:hypothetical protein